MQEIVNAASVYFILDIFWISYRCFKGAFKIFILMMRAPVKTKEKSENAALKKLSRYLSILPMMCTHAS